MGIDHFLEYLRYEKKYSENTIMAYKNDLETFSFFLQEEYGEQEPEEINYPQIRSWIICLVDRKISNRSINRKISSLKSFFRFLQKTRQIKISPLAKHLPLKTPKKVQVPFSEAEVEKVLGNFEASGFEEVRDKLIIELFYSTGIRRKELIEVKLHDLDLGNRILKVKGKRNKERFIPLLENVTEDCRIYLGLRKEVENERSDNYFFLTGRGVKIYDSLVYRIINNYFSTVSSKVKKSPHILRHSFATHLLNQGAGLNAVKELLGHSSLASTQVYTHNSLAELLKTHKTNHPRSRKKE